MEFMPGMGSRRDQYICIYAQKAPKAQEILIRVVCSNPKTYVMSIPEVDAVYTTVGSGGISSFRWD